MTSSGDKIARLWDVTEPARAELKAVLSGHEAGLNGAVFPEVVDVAGIVLTKLDGTAKGGIVFQVQRELGVPVKLVGLA